MDRTGRASTAGDEISSTSSDPSVELTEHYETVIRNMLRGRVTPVLGAGASLYGRPRPEAVESAPLGPAESQRAAAGTRSTVWNGAPSASELAEHLAREFKVTEPSNDLR